MLHVQYWYNLRIVAKTILLLGYESAGTPPSPGSPNISPGGRLRVTWPPSYYPAVDLRIIRKGEEARRGQIPHGSS